MPVGYSETPIVDEAGAHPYRIILDRPISYPLYLKALRPFAELDADGDTTTADAEGLVLETLFYIFDQLMTENATNKELVQVLAARRADVGSRAFSHGLASGDLQPRGKVIARYGSY